MTLNSDSKNISFCFDSPLEVYSIQTENLVLTPYWIKRDLAWKYISQFSICIHITVSLSDSVKIGLHLTVVRQHLIRLLC